MGCQHNMSMFAIKGIYEKQDMLNDKSNPIIYMMTNSSKNNSNNFFDLVTKVCDLSNGGQERYL